MTQREQFRMGRPLLPGDRANLPPSPRLRIGEWRFQSPLCARRLRRCTQRLACGCIGRLRPKLVGQIQAVDTAHIISTPSMPPARHVSKLDEQVACRQVDQQAVPLRSALCRRFVVELIRLGKGAFRLTAGTVDPERRHTASVWLAVVEHPKAKQPRLRHGQRQRDGRSSVARRW